MIVYNAGRRFFAMKADADAHRRDAWLPKVALHTIRIEDRDELAAFLNAIMEGSSVVEAAPAADEALDFIPQFVREDWKRRAQFHKGE